MSDSQNSNPPRDLAGEVIRLLILHTNAKREEISPSTRLQHDLGMDGDDAVDFFDQFSRQFNVDIDALKEDWALHFGPERLPLAAILVILLWGLSSGLLHLMFEQIPIWAFAAGLALCAGWVLSRLSRNHDLVRLDPVCVRDLVASAQSGRWTLAPSDPPG